MQSIGAKLLSPDALLHEVSRHAPPCLPLFCFTGGSLHLLGKHAVVVPLVVELAAHLSTSHFTENGQSLNKWMMGVHSSR